MLSEQSSHSGCFLSVALPPPGAAAPLLGSAFIQHRGRIPRVVCRSLPRDGQTTSNHFPSSRTQVLASCPPRKRRKQVWQRNTSPYPRNEFYFCFQPLYRLITPKMAACLSLSHLLSAMSDTNSFLLLEYSLYYNPLFYLLHQLLQPDTSASLHPLSQSYFPFSLKMVPYVALQFLKHCGVSYLILSS